MAGLNAGGAGTAFAHESVTVDNTSGGVVLTLATYRPSSTDFTLAAKAAYLTCEDAEIRWTYDGTAPTTAVGHLMQPGDSVVLYGYTNIAALKAIRTLSTSGTLKATYER